MFCAWEPLARSGAELVNEPSAWAMSLLRTPDEDAAAAFYGALFGWESEAGGPISLFRLPGFVGGEPEQPVPRDVVAAMMDGGDGSAGWAVDFWIADADAAAATAEQSGGRVLEPPADAGPFRRAVLVGPRGRRLQREPAGPAPVASRAWRSARCRRGSTPRADEMAELLEALVRDPDREPARPRARPLRGACCATRWSGSGSRPS